jgi:hypothetical protein
MTVTPPVSRPRPRNCHDVTVDTSTYQPHLTKTSSASFLFYGSARSFNGIMSSEVHLSRNAPSFNVSRTCRHSRHHRNCIKSVPCHSLFIWPSPLMLSRRQPGWFFLLDLINRCPLMGDGHSLGQALARLGSISRFSHIRRSPLTLDMAIPG